MCRFNWINFYSLSVDFIFYCCTLHVYDKLFEQIKVSISSHFWSGFLSSEHSFISGLLLQNSTNACFYHYRFTKEFPISSYKCFVSCKIFLFCLTDSFVFLWYLPVDGCFWYFQYDLIFDIYEYVFPASWCK